MKRFFIRIDNHPKVYVNRKFNLSDEDLFIKKLNNDGSISFDKIEINGLRFKNDQVSEYNNMLKNKRSEILVEIPVHDLNKINEKYLITYVEAKENVYFEDGIEFIPREFKLIDYGAAGRLPANTEVVVVLPSPIEQGKLQVSTTSSVLTLSGSDSYARRQALRKIFLGSDLYLHTEDEAILDECRTWITEMKEERYGIFLITRKNHIIYKPISSEERISLSKEEAILFENLIKYGNSVYITKDPAMIYLPDNPKIPQTAEIVFLLRREDIEPLIINGINELPFESHFSVIIQTENRMIYTNLEDAFDIPKTHIGENIEAEAEEISSLNAKKIHLFYEYNLGEELPMLLRGLPPVEFEEVDTTKRGEIIWEKVNSEKSFKSRNRCFIEITGPKEKEIIEEFGSKGLLLEFDLYEYPGEENQDMVFYTSKPYLPY